MGSCRSTPHTFNSWDISLFVKRVWASHPWNFRQKMMTTGHQTQLPLVLSNHHKLNHVSPAAPDFVLATTKNPKGKKWYRGPNIGNHLPFVPVPNPCPGFSFLAKLCWSRFCSRITAVLRSAAWTWDKVTSHGSEKSVKSVYHYDCYIPIAN